LTAYGPQRHVNQPAALLALAAKSDRANEFITLHLQRALQAAAALE
jgi:hypothetical protein